MRRKLLTLNIQLFILTFVMVFLLMYNGVSIYDLFYRDYFSGVMDYVVFILVLLFQILIFIILFIRVLMPLKKEIRLINYKLKR